jgi:TrmH family RNA methyltransferase
VGAVTTPTPGVIGARHPSIKRLRRLSRRRSARTDEGLFVVDGPVLVAEALDAGVALVEVVAEPGAPGPLLARAAAAGAAVHRAAAGTLAGATDTVTPQPIAAVARLRAVSPAAAATAAGPLALVLVGVADPGNAGTLLRSAEAAGAGAAAFCDGSVDPFGPKCVRASAGSLFRLAVVRAASAGDVLDAIRAAGGSRVATAANGAHPAYDAVDLSGRSGPVALVLGSEAHGLPAAVAAGVDTVVTIPMAGPTESLNVAMAGTVVCFEALRQRRANRLDAPPAATARWPATHSEPGRPETPTT